MLPVRTLRPSWLSERVQLPALKSVSVRGYSVSRCQAAQRYVEMML